MYLHLYRCKYTMGVKVVIKELLTVTAEERAQTVRKCEKQIDDLESEIAVLEAEAADLKNTNTEKINRRDAVTKQINTSKTRGNWLIFLSIVLAVTALLCLKADNQQTLRVGGITLGAVMFVLGIIVRCGWKKYESEYNEANSALSDYDAKQAKYDKQISNLSGQIDDLNEIIDEIHDFEANEDYYRFAAETDTGHVFVFVTEEMHLLDDSPRQPKPGKKYTSRLARECELYVDDMMYDSGKNVSAQNQYGKCYHAEIVDYGTHKLQMQAIIAPDKAIYRKIQSKPIPCRPSDKSVYLWWHLSTCKGGTYNYLNEYHSLDSFANAISLSKTEVMRYWH